MMRTVWSAILFMLVLSATGTAWAEQKTESRDAAEELASVLRSYQTYQANFIQIVVNGNGNQVQEIRGVLKAKRPGLFYWETAAPLSQFIVSDGDTVEVYDPDLEQVTIHTLDEQVQSTPALLLSGEVGNLDESYEVSERRIGDDTREYTLVPRGADSLFTSLRLTFYRGELQEMRMEDSLSQLSILSFDQVTLNQDLDSAVFSLDYPEEVDVIRDGA